MQIKWIRTSDSRDGADRSLMEAAGELPELARIKSGDGKPLSHETG